MIDVPSAPSWTRPSQPRSPRQPVESPTSTKAMSTMRRIRRHPDVLDGLWSTLMNRRPTFLPRRNEQRRIELFVFHSRNLVLFRLSFPVFVGHFCSPSVANYKGSLSLNEIGIFWSLVNSKFNVLSSQNRWPPSTLKTWQHLWTSS